MDVIPDNLLALLPPIGAVNPSGVLTKKQKAISSLRDSLLKKFQPIGDNKLADKNALHLFLECNKRCGTWVPDVDSPVYEVILLARTNLAHRYNSGELQAPKISISNCWDKLRPGPGSSIGTKLSDYVGKMFNSCLTAYDSTLWNYYLGTIPTQWKPAEIARAAQYGGCVSVNATRLTFAKKNFDISRVINTEASLNMLYQLALGAQIEDCLEEWFNIRLDRQPKIHGHLARLGSIYGSHATIDLKSASDLISLEFMRWFLPPVLFRTLTSVRSQYIEFEKDNGRMDKRWLNIFSTMGNGFTFPLQTLIFASIVEAVYESAGLPVDNVRYPSFSVFGDDIICVGTAFDSVCQTLEWCGFTVNKLKSFNSGSFRESCGKDYYEGHDVRGVYIKKFFHETHYYSVFNRLTRWSLRNCIDLTDILRHIKGLAVFQPVPLDESDSAGHKVPFSHSGKTNRIGAIRYKVDLPRADKRSTIDYEANPHGLFIGALGGFVTGHNNSTKISTSGRDALVVPYHPMFLGRQRFDELIMEQKCFYDWQADYVLPVGTFTVRSRPDGPPDTVKRRKTTPSWDWIPQPDLTIRDFEVLFESLNLPA